MNSTAKGSYNSVNTPIVPLDYFAGQELKDFQVPEGVTLHFKRTGMNEANLSNSKNPSPQRHQTTAKRGELFGSQFNKEGGWKVPIVSRAKLLQKELSKQIK